MRYRVLVFNYLGMRVWQGRTPWSLDTSDGRDEAGGDLDKQLWPGEDEEEVDCMNLSLKGRMTETH